MAGDLMAHRRDSAIITEHQQARADRQAAKANIAELNAFLDLWPTATQNQKSHRSRIWLRYLRTRFERRCCKWQSNVSYWRQATISYWSLAGDKLLLESSTAGGAYTLTADAGAYTLAGQDATLKTRIVTADAGSYAVGGQDASVLVGHKLAADAGAYSVAGQDDADLCSGYSRSVHADMRCRRVCVGGARCNAVARAGGCC